jgi:hypothetical protein
MVVMLVVSPVEGLVEGLVVATTAVLSQEMKASTKGWPWRASSAFIAL